MLFSTKKLIGQGIAATDGEIGEVTDLLFDDRTWNLRYLVVRTGRWLGWEVLIHPATLGRPDWATDTLSVSLSRREIERSPDITTDSPVSRQHEEPMASRRSWKTAREPDPKHEAGSSKAASLTGDDHLRSSVEVSAYRIEASDGAIGHVHDFIIDERTWTLRYLVVDTRKWLPGRKVLVSTSWIDDVDWPSRTVRVDLPCERIENSPEFDPSAPVNRRYEERLYDYYGRPAYWHEEDRVPR